MPNNVYLIRQDHTHLFGDVLDTAVVIADSVNAARKRLTAYLYSNESPITWDASMWMIIRLGNNAKHPRESSGPVVCSSFCNKYNLPPGNYLVSKHS